ncbi:glycosyltransferase [Rhodanobacter sp. Si-c]|uniref:Glycosyltransferase n=1 Tax=Rhodanobacter lycopersici TaxID=3162487 RepID=A0ABV3QE55_9GAMM
MTTAPRIQLLARDNGAGLSRDMALLAAALGEAGASIRATGLPHRGRFAEWLTRARLAWRVPAFELNLMLERVRPEFARAARRNVLVPNPEYFRVQDRAALDCIDTVWVKTRHAGRLFAALGKPVRHIGFTSPDRLDPAVPRRHTFFHGPGRSNNKGTTALLQLWAAHPEWPMLTVAWRRKRVELGALPANVRLIRKHLDDKGYRRLQNEHRFHLCPSQTEGFGHYLIEAMSCGAVAVTLDAEPMNELVTAERGVLVPAQATGTQDLATLYGFRAGDMARAIERCAAMPEEEAGMLGAAARSWYEVERDAFPARLRAALDAV